MWVDMDKNYKIAVIGLGYVGLPVAVALSKFYQVTGFDIYENRIQELQNFFDRNLDISAEQLLQSNISFTNHPQDLKNKDIYIIAVPTPVDKNNVPDLTCIEKASELCGKYIQKGSIVVYESTVYPGVTEDLCGHILEKVSGLKCGKDFFLGYSPERINPGSKEHSIDKVVKVVAGQNDMVAKILINVYSKVNNGQVYKASSIKVAESSKVIENAQRDLNIAFINEVTMILSKLGISIYDVLETASTKWNFMKFTPGLVGGHCIGVDPYYLAYLANKIGCSSDIISAGRRVNEQMPSFIAEEIHKKLSFKSSKILCLGITFKQDVPDIRNSKSINLINCLQEFGHDVSSHDPYIDDDKKFTELSIKFIKNLNDKHQFDAILLAVPHKKYSVMQPEIIKRLIKPTGMIFDIHNLWKDVDFSKDDFLKYVI